MITKGNLRAKITNISFKLLFFVCLSGIMFSYRIDAADQKEKRKDVGEVDRIIVTASRSPISFSDRTRKVIVITREEIQRAPVHSPEEAIEYALGIDLKTRGALGVLSDISIRGSTYEQVLVLIDGIKMNNPQTGHFSMNIPVNLDDIERIEILKGPGSKVHGPNAFSGAINIITRNSKQKEIVFQGTTGSFDFYEGNLTISYPIGFASNRISVSKKQSSGHRENTDFDILTYHIASSLDLSFGKVNLAVGSLNKKYGANSFYTSAFPNQWEHTITNYMNVQADIIMGSFSLSPKIYWTGNDDDFMLDRYRPDWYRNKHATDRYGLELQSTFYSGLGATSVGAEFIQDDLESSRLGNHIIQKGGFFLEQQISSIRNLTLVLGTAVYTYTGEDWQLWPGIDIGYRITNKLRLFSSANKSFRLPSFTELYYSDPVHRGNPDLKPEEAWTYEFGLSYQIGQLSIITSYARKEGENLIDWAKLAVSSAWESMNVSEVHTDSFELSLDYTFSNSLPILGISRFRISYAYLNSDRKTKALESKYVFDYLENQFIVAALHDLPFDICLNWNSKYEQRINRDGVLIIDCKISKDFNGFQIFAEVKNLLDIEYEDIGAVIMPGRWMFAGFKIN